MFSRKNHKFIILIVLLSASVFFILSWQFNFFSFDFLQNGQVGIKIGKQECSKIGGEMQVCINSGLCCVKNFSDGGKQCSSSSDCEAGICTIDNTVQKTIQGHYTGTCPRIFVGEKLRCGEAALENGETVKDLRNKKCVLY